MSIQENPTVFIAYPHEFSCYEKFERKITKILSNLKTFSLVYPEDYLGFIAKMSGSDKRVKDAIMLSDDKPVSDSVDYAIIFNDNQSFSTLITNLSSKNIPTRLIDTSVTRVANVDKKEKFDVYIGRGSDWGNPYVIGIDGNREDVIRKYQYDFERGYLKGNKQKLLQLKGKVLGCHCKPLACHGDILADYLNSLDDGK